MFTPINQITTGTIRLIPQPKSEDYGHSLTEACFGYPFEGDTHSAGSDLIDGGKPQGMCVGRELRSVRTKECVLEATVLQAFMRKRMCVGSNPSPPRPRQRNVCWKSRVLNVEGRVNVLEAGLRECVLEILTSSCAKKCVLEAREATGAAKRNVCWKGDGSVAGSRGQGMCVGRNVQSVNVHSCSYLRKPSQRNVCWKGTMKSSPRNVKMFALINQITTGTIRLIPQPKSESYGYSLAEACFGYPFEGDTHSAGSDLIDRGKPPQRNVCWKIAPNGKHTSWRSVPECERNVCWK